MTENTLTAADYERASEIITPKSWTRGREGFSASAYGVIADEGRYCYLGALKKAHWERTEKVIAWWDSEADSAEQAGRTWKEYHEFPKYSVDSPWGWNDLVAESAEEVSVKLMEIGKFLRNKGEEING